MYMRMYVYIIMLAIPFEIMKTDRISSLLFSSFYFIIFILFLNICFALVSTTNSKSLRGQAVIITIINY